MTAYHLDFDATHAHIGAADDLALRRANIQRRAEIMAEMYAERRLSPATGCALASTHRAAASCGQQAANGCVQSDCVRCSAEGGAA